jgi:hypothetical protein
MNTVPKTISEEDKQHPYPELYRILEMLVDSHEFSEAADKDPSLVFVRSIVRQWLEKEIDSELSE